MKIVSKRSIFLAALVLSVSGLASAWTEPKLFRELLLDDEVPPPVEGPTTTNALSEDDETEAGPEPTEVAPVITQGRPWQPPNYSGQEGALGWTPETFQVPAGLRDRVDFWKEIYTKYSTDQGLLHDSEHVKVVYESIDFTPIMKNAALSDREKRKQRKKLVETTKDLIKERLQKLSRIQTPADGSLPAGLTPEEVRYWQMFSSINEENKFQKALDRRRLRFQLGQKDKFYQGIFYSGRYLNQMEAIFRSAGLPIELTRLPFVESSFNVKARSRVGASGIWQFMRYTGRKFMQVNYASDERNDPIEATRSAARFMKINYDMLGKWSLALTAYNHGAAGVRRMVEKFRTDDIVELVDERHGRFKFASANFYACFLAALEVEKEATKYFGPVVWDQPLEGKEIQLTRRVGKKLIEGWFEGDLEKAKDLNPHITKSVWLGYAQLSNKDFVRVPANRFDVAVAELQKLPETLEVASNDIQYYMIGSGQTLSEIANELGVSVAALMDINGIENPRRIRAGQKLMVPKKN